MVILTLIKSSLKWDNLSKAQFLHKTQNNAGEDMWLQAETTCEKLKLDEQTQDADGVKALYLAYMTQLEAISQQQYISWEG